MTRNKRNKTFKMILWICGILLIPLFPLTFFTNWDLYGIWGNVEIIAVEIFLILIIAYIEISKDLPASATVIKFSHPLSKFIAGIAYAISIFFILLGINPHSHFYLFDHKAIIIIGVVYFDVLFIGIIIRQTQIKKKSNNN